MADQRKSAREGIEALEELIQSARRGIGCGEDPRELAERLWPNVLLVVARARVELDERTYAGMMRFLDENALLKKKREEQRAAGDDGQPRETPRKS